MARNDFDLSEIELFTHPSSDVQCLIDEFLSIERRLRIGKTNYSRSFRAFWKKFPRHLDEAILISEWQLKVEAERDKLAERGIDLESRYRMEESRNYKESAFDFFKNFSCDHLVNLLRQFPANHFLAVPEHENLKKDLLENFRIKYPKHFETPELEESTLQYLKKSCHLKLQAILKEYMKQKFDLGKEKLQELVNESVGRRCDVGPDKLETLLIAADSINAASDAVASLRDKDPAGNDDDEALNVQVIANGASASPACARVVAHHSVGVDADVVPCHHGTNDDRGLDACQEILNADACLEFQKGDIQSEILVSCFQDITPGSCFVCGSPAARHCEGNPGSPCVVQGSFCEKHCYQGACYLCRPAMAGPLRRIKGIDRFTCTSCSVHSSKNAAGDGTWFTCRQCKDRFCKHCALRWETEKVEIICPADATRADFYKERHEAARALATKVETLLNSVTTSSPSKEFLNLLDRFCLMFRLLQQHQQFDISSELQQVLIMVLEYQERNVLRPSVTVSQSEWLYLPGGNEASRKFIHRIARMERNAHGRGDRPRSFEKPAGHLKPRKRAHEDPESPVEAATKSRVAAGALIFIGAGHCPNQLMCSTWKQLLEDPGVDLYILAIGCPNMKILLISDLVSSFTRLDRWIDFSPEDNDLDIARQINGMRLRVVLDFIGSREGTRPKLLQSLDSGIYIVNFADSSPPCNGSTWNGSVVDKRVLKALEGHTDVVKGLYQFSSRRPPLDSSFVNGVDRTRCRVRAPGSTFNIFVASRMDRIGPDDRKMLWTILTGIPDAHLHFYGCPMFCINGFLEGIRELDKNECIRLQNLQAALEHCGSTLNGVSVASRIKFMRHVSTLTQHMDRLRNEMDVALAWGSNDDDVLTATDTCLTAGLGVLTLGRRGAGWELDFLGLGCLVLEEEDRVHSVVQNLVELRDNHSLLEGIRQHLDGQARAGSSLFDQSRFPEEIKELIQRLNADGTGVLDFVTCQPEPHFITRASNGKLMLVSSPEPPFDSQPPDCRDVWSLASGSMECFELCDPEGPIISGNLKQGASGPVVSEATKLHGCQPAPSRRRSAPAPAPKAGISYKVARPRPLLMTLLLTISHCSVPGVTGSLRPASHAR